MDEIEDGRIRAEMHHRPESVECPSACCEQRDVAALSDRAEESPPLVHRRAPRPSETSAGARTRLPAHEGPAAGSGAAAATPGATAPRAPAGDWILPLVQPAQESRNWLKFMGLVSILLGGFSAVTIVGLLFAWLYILSLIHI